MKPSILSTGKTFFWILIEIEELKMKNFEQMYTLTNNLTVAVMPVYDLRTPWTTLLEG